MVQNCVVVKPCWEEIFASGAPGARYLGLIPSDDLTGLVEYPSGQVIAAGDFFYSDGTYNRVNGSASAENEALEFAYSVSGDSAIYYSDFSGNAGRYGCIWIERNINI